MSMLPVPGAEVLGSAGKQNDRFRAIEAIYSGIT